MLDILTSRQHRLEEEALGLGLARAHRMISGEASQEDVEIFGVDTCAAVTHRRCGFLYTIASMELPKLVKVIQDHRENSGTKSASIFTILEQCGSDAEIAGIVIKTFFSALLGGNDNNDDEDENTGIVSMVSMANKVADAVFHLNRKSEVRTKQNRQKSGIAPKKTTKPPSETDRLRIGLVLVDFYLKSTQCFTKCATSADMVGGFRGPNAVEVTDDVMTGLFEEFSGPVNEKIGADEDIPALLLERNLVSPAWTPMLVAPKPWEAMRNGGYIGGLAGKVSLVKGRNVMKGFSAQSCPAVFEAINNLQETKFRINPFVFEVFQSLFDALSERLKHHQPGNCDYRERELNCFDILLNVPREKMYYYFRENEKPSRFLRKSMVNLLLLKNEAHSFLGETVYFVHCCDFRGRTYPVAGRLNYQASDLPRSLIEFAGGKPITDCESKKWLAIHGANCYAEKINEIGRDKMPFAERLAWVKENEKSILALGRPSGSFWDLPAELEEWWLKADKPWAFLAWAHEWADYKADPSGFLSHLPVAVDGSSNGYQHIAALLRSRNLAEQVNMLPTERPHDIYTRITYDATTEISRHKDVSNNIMNLCSEYRILQKKKKSKESQDTCQFKTVKKKILALCMEGYLPRSAAKRIVMTYPYSATQYRMMKILEREHLLFRKWVAADIRSASKDIPLDLETVNAASQDITHLLPTALAEVIVERINHLFPEVFSLLDWFKEMGKSASNGCQCIEWKSPTGFVVRQDYEEKKSCPVSAMGKKFTYKAGTGEPDNDKHKSGLGPNFIHSCDAAHMMRTVNAASNAGIGSLRMIHDSYATHAADMEKLYRILREEFVRMYSEANWLARLGESLREQAASEFEVEPVPIVGDFDLSQVMDADYFFA